MNKANHHGRKVVDLKGVGPSGSNGKHAGTGRRHLHDGLEQRVAELEQQVTGLLAENAELVRSNKQLANADRLLQVEIAKHKRTEEALCESQALYHSLVEHMPAGIFRKDREGRYVLVNSWFCELRGMKAEEIPGKTSEELIAVESAMHGDKHPEVTQLLSEGTKHHDQIMRTGERIEVEEEYTGKDGQKRYLRVVKSPVFGPDGKIIGTQGVQFDVTDRKKAEDELRRSNEALFRIHRLLQALLDIAPDRIYFKDTNSRFLMLSRSLARRFNLDDPEDAVGKMDFDFQLPERAKEFYADEQRIMQTGEPLINKIEKQIAPNGEVGWTSTNKVPLRDQDGKVIGLAGINRDITDLKRAEEALRESQALYSSLVEQLPVGIFRKDPAGRYILVNPWFCRLKGMKAEEFLGKTPGEVTASDAAKRDPTAPTVDYAGAGGGHHEQIMQTGKSIDVIEEYIHADGTKKFVHALKLPICDLSGKIIGTQGILSDITDIKQAEAALRQSEEKLRLFASQLERSNRELQDFAYVASHDLQEPLRKVAVFGERLKEKNDGKFDPESLDYLARMQSATGRMQTLINSLLTFSRVTTKAQPFAPVNLAEVAASVVDDLEGRIEQVKGRVEVGPLPVIDAEPVQMRQLLQNLIGNALKFRRPEEPPVVKVNAEIISDPSVPGKKLCRLTVSDNCIGFEEKYAERIFQVFQRLHTRNEYEGTGMGLAIVKKIALYHGGDVIAKSKPGEGSTFILTIPAAHPKNQPDEDQKKEGQKTPSVL
jgi:PAS domain S-box-containing protein